MTGQCHDMGNTPWHTVVPMPWPENDVSHLRGEFVLKALSPDANIAELCREAGISRKTGYKWLQRFRERGFDGLEDMSRRPLSNPLATTADMVVEVIALRRQHPTWGPRKLARVLERRARRGEKTPSARTIARILDRAGEVKKKRAGTRRPGRIEDAPKVEAMDVNDVWTVDFKGWWRAKDDGRCEPLTVRDMYSRFVLAVVLMPSTKTEPVQEAFQRLFEQHGLPQAILVDNGSPFASTSARGGLTRLSAWWVSLGIRLIRSRPGCPQDNGAHERMHADMSQELQVAPAETVLDQQAACDRWRHEFNHVRPHEALDGATPADKYKPSPRRFRGPRRPTCPPGCELRTVNSSGKLRFNGGLAYVGRSLCGYQVAVREAANDELHVTFFDLDLGTVPITRAS